MTNLEKYNRAFTTILGVVEEDLPGLKYRGIQKWDSIAHMDLMNEMEELFLVHLSTLDVLNFSSYEKGMDILEAYGCPIREKA
ncbi:MAG: acyl carrier protein [Eubacterium sp.]|jgi:acyl carrier protein